MKSRNFNRQVSIVVDITEISAMVAAAGVLVGVVYYILDMRNQNKMRRTDLLMRLHQANSTKEMVEAAQKFVSLDYKDYDDFVQKYGSLYSEGEVQTAFIMIGQFFEGIGVLMKNGLADINLVTQLFARATTSSIDLGRDAFCLVPILGTTIPLCQLRL
jgi:hypothetical protein